MKDQKWIEKRLSQLRRELGEWMGERDVAKNLAFDITSPQAGLINHGEADVAEECEKKIDDLVARIEELELVLG
jgi:hypothetical protein